MVFLAFWPVLVILSLYFKKKREEKREEGDKKDKSSAEIREDRKLFSSVGSASESKDMGWPLGYIGFNPKAATDEVIKRFEEDKDKNHKEN